MLRLGVLSWEQTLPAWLMSRRQRLLILCIVGATFRNIEPGADAPGAINEQACTRLLILCNVDAMFLY